MGAYFTEIIVFISGGGLISFLNYLRDRKKDKNDDFSLLVAEYKHLIEECKRDFEELYKTEIDCRESINQLDKDIYELRSKILIIENSNFDIPFPTWLKNTDLKMLALNKKYEQMFLFPVNKTILDYLGKTDKEVWGEEIGFEYSEHDMELLNGLKEVWIGKETIIIKGNNISERWRIIKYVRKIGTTVIGIGGIAIPVFENPNVIE